jgi:hypothetical protein
MFKTFIRCSDHAGQDTESTPSVNVLVKMRYSCIQAQNIISKLEHKLTQTYQVNICCPLAIKDLQNFFSGFCNVIKLKKVVVRLLGFESILITSRLSKIFLNGFDPFINLPKKKPNAIPVSTLEFFLILASYP